MDGWMDWVEEEMETLGRGEGSFLVEEREDWYELKYEMRMK